MKMAILSDFDIFNLARNLLQVEYIKVKNYMYFTAVSGQAIYFLKGQRNVT